MGTCQELELKIELIKNVAAEFRLIHKWSEKRNHENNGWVTDFYQLVPMEAFEIFRGCQDQMIFQMSGGNHIKEIIIPALYIHNASKTPASG